MLASYTHNVHASITALAGFWTTGRAQGGRDGGPVIGHNMDVHFGHQCTSTTLLVSQPMNTAAQ